MELTLYYVIDKTIITTAFTIFIYFFFKEIYKSKSKNLWLLKRWKKKDYERLEWTLKNKWVFVIFAVVMILIMLISRLFFW